MVAAGVILAAFPVVFWSQILLLDWLSDAPDPYYSSQSGFMNSEAFFFLMGYGGSIGIFLVGIAALRAKGLGFFRFLPIIISVLSAPLIGFIIFRLYSGGTIVIVEPNVWVDVAVATPSFLASLGWIAVGVMMFGAKEREAKTISKERHETEQRNLALARRLYNEAWGEKKLLVVDEIASEDFFDRRRNREGSAAFKQAISDLHHAFPDLNVEIEEQTAEGDAVATRIIFSGTDRGGVLYYPPTYETATFDGTFTDRFEDGKLIKHDGEMDEEILMEQLGLPSER
ncbi:MAG: ester cyclase [Actinomycetota bacterium]|nr:ester cyclase [Rubrobacter sp.]MDQ3507969.1 ester cyclase [Actinomycetota bacterium]